MARRKRQTSPQPEISKSQPKKHVGLIASIIVTLILAGIPFGLGKYIELNSPGPYDSGAYAYSAKHLLQGARLGIDERSSAQPNTLIANIIGVKLFGFNDVGPKIVQMILQLIAGIFMFYTLRRVFGTVAAVIGTTIATIYLSAPVIAKYGNVKEQFMIAFMIYAACSLLLYEFTQKRYWLPLAGFFALQPYYFKATGLTIVIATVLYILQKNTFAKKGKTLCMELLLFLVGYASGLLLPLSLFVWQKQPQEILKAFPPFALKVGLLFVIILFAILHVAPFVIRFFRNNPLNQVSKKTWIAGLILIILIFVFSVCLVSFTGNKSDVYSYIRSIPVISIPTNAVSLARHKLMDATGLGTGYLTGARAAIDTGELAKKIGRYYMTLKVPILLALTSVITAAMTWVFKRIKKSKPQAAQSKAVWLLAIWWILDMGFIWISPRSYEQYYLPLCASAAMLGAYCVWQWNEKLKTAANKIPLLAAGLAAMIVLSSLALPIFIGLTTSPDTGIEQKQRYRGYTQSLQRVKNNYQQSWQIVGDYIHTHTTENDTIYVWGWIPGIYVEAQRLAPVPSAFESDMHIKSPNRLKGQIASLVKEMEKNPPKFIVDTRKRHIPWNRPPLELWPVVPPKLFGNKTPHFLSNNEQEIAAFDTWYSNQLKTKINPQEAQRYEAMKLFRDFVMTHYKPIVMQQFGNQRLYERIASSPPTKP